MEQKKYNSKKTNKKKESVIVKPTEIRAGGYFEYKMPYGIYNDYVKSAKKENAGDIQTYLCNIVNEQYGLLGTCVRVIPY